ncbi:MAG: hypothetical protein ATN36_04500 [Epulopiscium sp. Nele67-Bin005]|nr:MAG: hypothetical protein ATN36_04500 [Epulopiscium sp. Nele67-Bin005]
MEKFKNLPLGKKLTLIIGLFVTLILAVTTLITAYEVNILSQKAVLERFSAKAQYNALYVQSLIDEAYNFVIDTQAFIVDEYKSLMYHQHEHDNESLLYNMEFSGRHQRVEDFLINRASYANKNNAHIFGIGVYFEPYAFDPEKEVYAFKVDDSSERASAITNLNDYIYEDFYTTPKDTYEPYVSKPRVLSNGVIVSHISYPIIIDEEFKGVVVADILASNFDKTKVVADDFPTIFSSVLSSDWEFVYDSRIEGYVGHNLVNYITEKSLEEIEALVKKGEPFKVETVYPDGTKHFRILSPIYAGAETWWALIGIEPSDLYSDVTHTTFIIVSFSILAILSLNIVIRLVARKILNPLEDVLDAQKSIGEGKLDINISNPYEDEIGVLSRGFVDMSDKLKNIIREIDNILTDMAKGDLTAVSQLKVTYNGDFFPIKNALNDISQNLSASLREINLSVEEVSHGASEIAYAAVELAKGATEQTIVVDSFVETTQEIAAHISETALSFKESERICQDAKQKAGEGAECMNEMLDAMKEIGRSSQIISDVLKTVESIADQTSLLALNASIEAARAGDLGKGFVVVANEIRDLANRSTVSVQQVDEVIKASLASVERGQQIANQTANSLIEIVETVDKTANISKDLLDASQKQSESVTELVEGTNQIASVILVNAAASQESAAISQELAAQAEGLRSLVSHFKFD